jgi:uncharacterized protein YkwD
MGVHRLAARGAAALVVLLASSATASASAACPADAVQPTDATGDAAAAAVLCDVNSVRAGHGLQPLRWDGRLASAAQGMADDMAARHYASHVTPDGVDFTTRIKRAGYLPANSVWWVAENLGWGTNVFSTPSAIVDGWMGSQAHRDNLLDQDMRDVGIGVAQGAISAAGPSGTIYVADFGTRGTAAATVRKSRAHARRSRAHARRVRHHRHRRR